MWPLIDFFVYFAIKWNEVLRRPSVVPTTHKNSHISHILEIKITESFRKQCSWAQTLGLTRGRGSSWHLSGIFRQLQVWWVMIGISQRENTCHTGLHSQTVVSFFKWDSLNPLFFNYGGFRVGNLEVHPSIHLLKAGVTVTEKSRVRSSYGSCNTYSPVH